MPWPTRHASCESTKQPHATTASAPTSDAASAMPNSLISPRLVWNLRLDQLRELRERILPPKIAGLGRNDGRNAFLHDLQFRADQYLLDADRGLHLALEIRIVELVRVTNAAVGDELQVGATEGMAVAGREIGERHLMSTADPRIHMMALAGEPVRRQPFRHRVRVGECAVELLRATAKHAVKLDGVAFHGQFSFSMGASGWSNGQARNRHGPPAGC